MRSTTNHTELIRLHAIIGKLNADMQALITPHLSAYLNAVDFDLKQTQHFLAEFLASNDYQEMLTLMQRLYGKIIFHDNLHNLPDDDDIHILIEKNSAQQPLTFFVTSKYNLDLAFFLEEIDKRSSIIKNNQCTYVDYCDTISKRQIEISELMMQSAKMIQPVPINDNLQRLINLITEFNDNWGEFIPMEFEFKKQNANKARVELKWKEMHKTSHITSPRSESMSIVKFVELGEFKDLCYLKISAGKDANITITRRVDAEKNVSSTRLGNAGDNPFGLFATEGIDAASSGRGNLRVYARK